MSVMGENLSAQDIVFLHKNPPKQLSLPGSKGLFPKNTAEEAENTTNSLNILKELLNVALVDRRHSRSEAQWIPEKRLALVTRRVGNTFSQYGYEKNGEIFLSPEEALFLIQMNKLELQWNGIPFSIEQAFAVLINSEQSLAKFRTFQELALNGYRAKHPKFTKKRVNSTGDAEEVAKKLKSSQSRQVGDSNNCEDSKKEDFRPVFYRLQDEGPTTADFASTYNPLFNLFLPKSLSRGKEADFDVTLKSNSSKFSTENVSTNESSLLTSFAGNESVSFYQFHKVDLDTTDS